MSSNLNTLVTGLKRALPVLVATLALTAGCLAAFGQVELGRITGTVTDSNGALITGAKVKVLDTQRNVAQRLTTDRAGLYYAVNLVPSTYKVIVEANGFKTFVRENVKLETGQEIHVDCVLQLGTATETVTVTGEMPLLDSANAIEGGTINNQTINNLPLNGRDYQSLLTIRPGMFQYAGGGSYTQSTNGIRPDANGWLVDGQLNIDPATGRSVIGVQSPLTDTATVLPVDAIQEFSTETNPKATVGWKTGDIVNVGIKSGTNQIHGTLYAFGRDGAWDARNYFNPATTPGSSLKTPPAPLQLYQYGVSMGGPIKKDRLFYFGNYEAYHSELGVVETYSIPYTQSGSSVPGVDPLIGSIPDAEADLAAHEIPLSQVSLNLLNLYPTNNSASAVMRQPLLMNTNDSYNGIGKITYNLNSRNILSGFLYWGQYNGFGQDRPYVNQAFELHDMIKTVANSDNWIFTINPHWLNEVRFGFNRETQTDLNNDATVPATQYGLNTGVPISEEGVLTGGLPQISIAGLNGLGAYGPIGGNGTAGPNPYYRVEDIVSYFHGKHAIQFGGEWVHANSEDDNMAGSRGEIDFGGYGGPYSGQAIPQGDPIDPNGSTTLEDFLSGYPTAGNLPFGSSAHRTLLRWQTAEFIQDDWRATSKLTLNLGLRYEFAQVPHEQNNQLGNFLPSVGLVQEGLGGNYGFNHVFNPDYKLFSPRLGMAMDLGKGTVLRAGYSLEYELPNLSFMTQGLTTDPTGAILGGPTDPVTGAPVNGVLGPGNITRTTINYNGFQLTWPQQPNSSTTVFPVGGQSTCTNAGAAGGPPCDIWSIDPNFVSPKVMSWNVSVEHAFTPAISLELAYVGNVGRDLMSIIDQNSSPVGAGWCANTPLTAAQIANGCTAPINDPNYLNDPNNLPPGYFSAAQYLQANEQAASRYFTQYPYLWHIIQLGNLDYSNYNGLQATLTMRNAYGLNVTTGYTYSHALDTSSENAFNALPVNSYSGSRDSEYGNSDFDLRHRLEVALTYDIPGRKSPAQILQGWQFNTIFSYQTSAPWTATDTSDDLSGNANNWFFYDGVHMGDRWDFTGNPKDFKSGGANPIPYFPGSSNPKCVAAAGAIGGQGALNSLAAYGCFVKGSGILTPPAPGTLGNSTRNEFPDTGFVNWNASLFKNFKLGERYRVELRAEFFNVLNHPNFNNPYGGVSGWGSGSYADPSTGASGIFGEGGATPDVGAGNPVIGSGDSREIQLGMKLNF